MVEKEQSLKKYFKKTPFYRCVMFDIKTLYIRIILEIRKIKIGYCKCLDFGRERVSYSSNWFPGWDRAGQSIVGHIPPCLDIFWRSWSCLESVINSRSVSIILFMKFLLKLLSLPFCSRYTTKPRFGAPFMIIRPFCTWPFWGLPFFCRIFSLIFWKFWWWIWLREASFWAVWRPCWLTLRFWLLFRWARFFFCLRWLRISSF